MMAFGMVALVMAGFFISQTSSGVDGGVRMKEMTGDEMTDVVNNVSMIMYLPEGEVPTIATVTDPGELTDQAFFKKAKKGYKVLIYSEAKKAIPHDPDEKKL